jgi:FlaG/FlaF family flagellin (archaellin)
MAARKSLAGAVFFTGTFRALQYPIPAATLTVRVDSATITVMAVSFTLLKDNKEVCK